MRVLGGSSVTRTMFTDSCGVVPDELPDPEVFAGGVITGNLCWSVLTTDVPSLLLYDKPFLRTQTGKFLSRVSSPGAVPVLPAAPASAPIPIFIGRSNPVPKGQTVPLAGGWNVIVVSSTPNATAQVLATSPFNKAPASGDQFFIVRIRATYTGSAFDRFDGSFRLRAVGPSGVVKTTFNNSCGVVPDSLADPDVYPSGTIEGNVCWEIPSSDAAGMALFDHPFLGGDSPFFLAVGP